MAKPIRTIVRNEYGEILEVHEYDNDKKELKLKEKRTIKNEVLQGV